jgi:hypothetical protein
LPTSHLYPQNSHRVPGRAQAAAGALCRSMLWSQPGIYGWLLAATRRPVAAICAYDAGATLKLVLSFGRHGISSSHLRTLASPKRVRSCSPEASGPTVSTLAASARSCYVDAVSSRRCAAMSAAKRPCCGRLHRDAAMSVFIRSHRHHARCIMVCFKTADWHELSADRRRRAAAAAAAAAARAAPPAAPTPMMS